MNSGVVDLQNSTALSNSQLNQTPKANGGELGKEEFLRLLLTQLSAQNPLDPMDPQQFVAQLSQFASLEQLTNMGKGMQDLITFTAANNSANVVGLLGKEVRVAASTITGPGKIQYDLPRDAASVDIQFLDDRGFPVHRIVGAPGEKGMHELDVTQLKPGQTYSMVITAKDKNGIDMSPTISMKDQVVGVNFDGPTPTLLLKSGQKVNATALLEIMIPQAAAAPAPTPAPAPAPTPTPDPNSGSTGGV